MLAFLADDQMASQIFSRLPWEDRELEEAEELWKNCTREFLLAPILKQMSLESCAWKAGEASFKRLDKWEILE